MKKHRVILVDCGSSRVPEIQAAMTDMQLWHDTVSLNDISASLANRFDVVVISGGPRLWTEPEAGTELRRLFQFLSDCHSAIFGICLGHQALAVAAGGSVYRGVERRSVEKVIWTEEHSLSREFHGPLEFATDHCEGVSPPAGYRILARSHDYLVEVMAHESLPRVGVQFHPESSGPVGRLFMRQVFKFLTGG